MDFRWLSDRGYLDTPQTSRARRWPAEVERLESRAVPTITGTPATFIFTPSVQFNGQVASFTDSNGTASTSNTEALIDWGDSTSTTGTVNGPVAGTFTIT